MRHIVLAGFLGLTGVVPAVFTAPPVLARTAPAAAAVPAPQTRIVEYGGVRLSVPAGWPVYRLDQQPSRCLRYDQHAVYLGRAGADQDCPARMAGRTETLQIEPLEEPADGSPAGSGTSSSATEDASPPLEAVSPLPQDASPSPPDTASPESQDASPVPQDDAPPLETVVTQEVKTVLPAAGVRLIGTYGSDPAFMQRVLRGVRIRHWAPRALPSPRTPDPGEPDPVEPDPVKREAGEPGAGESGVGKPGSDLRIGVPYRPVTELGVPQGRRRVWATGAGFDACTAPSTTAMAAWRQAYRVANVYIGGAARGCAQPNLTRNWVGTVRRMGYRLIPTYVGLQAPCSDYHNRFHAKSAYRVGRASADDAVRRAGALGIPRGEPIYFDMEAYPRERAWCRRAVLNFIQSWSRRLERRGYVSGMYGSAGAGVQDLGEATGITKPEAIWFARWDGKAGTAGGRYLRRSWWTPHRRIKQYRGGHHERHGGVTLNVDSNVVDGLVY